MHLFAGRSANEVWCVAAAKLLNEPDIPIQPGRGEPTREMLHAAFEIRNPRDRWVLARQPAMNPAFPIVEVVWTLRGRRDSGLLNYWNPGLPEYAGCGPEYHGAYGFRLRHQFGFDQLDRAYLALQHKPDSRQVVLQIWDPTADFPDEQGREVSKDVPCNVSSMLKVRDGKLEWTQIMRSNDIFRGVPHNFVQFTSLQEVMAGWLGLEVGSYTHLSDSLHAYESTIDLLRDTDFHVEGLSNADSLCLPKRESDEVFRSLDEDLSTIVSNDLRDEDLQKLVESSGLPRAYENLLRVVAADAARRKRWNDLATNLVAGCTNPALTQAWDRWLSRFSAS
jgi:thymidylate synthase